MGRTGDRLAAALSVAAALFLIGVMYAGLTLPQRPKPTDYSLTIRAESRGDEVIAQGTTNLPDGARLAVVVDRLYRIKGNGTWHTARVGEKVVEVEGGAWRAVIPIDDETWVHRVAQRVNARELDPVEAVQSKLRATVVFSPMVPQVGLVWDSMGGGFEGLSKSEAAFRAGGQWLIRRHTTFERPLRRDLEQRLLARGS